MPSNIQNDNASSLQPSDAATLMPSNIHAAITYSFSLHTYIYTQRSPSRSNLCAYCPCLRPFCPRPVAYNPLLKPMDHWKMKKSDQNKKKINEVKKTHTQGNEIAIAEWNCVQQHWCPAMSKTTMPDHYNRLMQQRWCPAISTLPSHIHSLIHLQQSNQTSVTLRGSAWSPNICVWCAEHLCLQKCIVPSLPHMTHAL